MSKNSLDQIGESALLNLIQKWVSPTFSQSRSQVLLGIGDDCASIRFDAANQLLISTDLLVEDIHFRTIYFSPDQLGYKALAVNISDIAAMGGIPELALIGIAIPAKTHLTFIERLYKGFIHTCRDYGMQIIGGDTTGSLGPIMLAVSILGKVENENLLTRDGAQPGEKIMVTGDLGGAMLGLELLENPNTRKQKQSDEQKRNKFLHPLPRVNEARVLAKNHLATSMIDLSDSLSQDLYHLCRSSGVGAKINKLCLPIAPEVKALKTQLSAEDPYHYALAGGEDYELLFTVKAEDVERAKSLILTQTGTCVTEIGEICPAKEGISVFDEASNVKPLIPMGFDHFHIWKTMT